VSTSTNGRELWKSDGTSAGTVLLKDSCRAQVVHPFALANRGGTLIASFSAAPGGDFLWQSDGTGAGTVPIVSFAATAGAYVFDVASVNGKAMFSADDGVQNELWVSDGTSAGTVLIDVNPGLSSSNPDDLTVSNGTLFFSAFKAASGMELWKSDGTPAGTVRIKDIVPGSGSSNPTQLTDVDGTVFFTTFFGGELWKTDGTEAGTVQLASIGVGWLTNVNGTLFFAGDDGVNGAELWKSDGTPAGTVLVKNIASSNTSSNPEWLTNVNGTLFIAYGGSTGQALGKRRHGSRNRARERHHGRRISATSEHERHALLKATTTRRVDSSPGRATARPPAPCSWDIVPGLGRRIRRLQVPERHHVLRRPRARDSAELWLTDGSAAGTVRAGHRSRPRGRRPIQFHPALTPRSVQRRRRRARRGCGRATAAR
jgi:ELWxxDGT repeat protein